MVIGTSTKPRASAVFAHSAMRVDGARQRGGDADRAAVIARHHFQPRQRAVDLGRRRHGVEHDVGLGEGQVVGAGDLAGDAARRGAVVDIDQPALGGLAQHRRQRRFRRGEARAHVAGDADIALEAAHQPMQPVDILLGRERGQQRLRAGIVVGIVERLHRRLQQHFVIFRARALAPACRDRRHRARTRSVTGAGNFASASAVPVALMPRPPTTMAMRGASVLPAGSLRGWA